jgi:glutathione S-transferase
MSAACPIIVDDDGTVVGQSLAILEYLEDTRPGPDMRGKTPVTRAPTREITAVFDEAMTFFGLWARHDGHLNRGTDRESQDLAEICAARYFQKLRLVEQMIDGTEFLAGDMVTIADCVAMATLLGSNWLLVLPILRIYYIHRFA